MARAGFWTQYRKFYVEACLARGESRKLIGAKLGVTPRQITKAIHNHGLKPRPLLDAIPDAYGLRCAGCNDFIDGWLSPGFARFCDRCQAGDAPPERKWKPPLTAATGPDPDTPELVDLIEEGWELTDV